MNTTIKNERAYFGVILPSGTKIIMEDKNMAEKTRTAVKLIKEVRSDLCGDKPLMKLAARIVREGKGALTKDVVVMFCDEIDAMSDIIYC